MQKCDDDGRTTRSRNGTSNVEKLCCILGPIYFNCLISIHILKDLLFTYTSATLWANAYRSAMLFWKYRYEFLFESVDKVIYDVPLAEPFWGRRLKVVQCILHHRFPSWPGHTGTVSNTRPHPPRHLWYSRGIAYRYIWMAGDTSSHPWCTCIVDSLKEEAFQANKQYLYILYFSQRIHIYLL
jgi:hypothetical protein